MYLYIYIHIGTLVCICWILFQRATRLQRRSFNYGSRHLRRAPEALLLLPQCIALYGIVSYSIVQYGTVWYSIVEKSKVE